jgi:predicted nucleic acid-binding Zn ribbon protein
VRRESSHSTIAHPTPYTPRLSSKKKPQLLADLLAGVLQQAGIAERVEQAAVVPEWSALVGAQIASVTEPLTITADGTLFVAVRTNAWANELSLMEPELLRALNVKPGRLPVRKIRYQLKREPAP